MSERSSGIADAAFILIVLINEVTVHQVGLLLRWVTVGGYTVFVFDQATQANSAWPSLCGLAIWVLAMATVTAMEETASSA